MPIIQKCKIGMLSTTGSSWICAGYCSMRNSAGAWSCSLRVTNVCLLRLNSQMYGTVWAFDVPNNRFFALFLDDSSADSQTADIVQFDVKKQQVRQRHPFCLPTSQWFSIIGLWCLLTLFAYRCSIQCS